MPPKNKMNWIRPILGIIFCMSMIYPGVSAHAQQAPKETANSPSPAKPSQPVKSRSKEKRIIILGTTIVGSVAKPRAVYEVPWKEPESLKKGVETPYRSFQDEIFNLIDKEQFELEMDREADDH